MSRRENIQFFHQLDIEKHLQVLKAEHGAREHPGQPGAFSIGGALIQALIDHPELAPAAAFVRWTAEQELVAAGSHVYCKRLG